MTQGNPPEDAISALTFSPRNPTRLLVSSWDKYVHLYDTNAGLNGSKLTAFPHAAPVLDCCFGETDGVLFSGGLDWLVKLFDPETGKETTLGTHDGGVKSICYNTEIKALISGSWDHTVRLFDPRSPRQTSKHPQPHKIFSTSTINHKLVVAMASRSVYLYDVRNMAEPWQRRESSLKFMTRTVRCMPNGQGYASSSIEGRVAVEFFDASDESQKRKYAFKCHRQVEGGVDVVYPVNALAFHPVYGTFASGGGDGIVSLWDGMAKRRLRQYQKYPASIAALSFSNNGKYLAVGSSSGFEDGSEEGTCPPESVKILVRELGEGEGKGKGQ
ncbi:mitotic spindle checkpoint protein Bub3 [Maublancomyces gigas]|uniref:Mitotic spindle checkpoint protein Bub3 n=1 Tax=Discina gigas TaxID=1032678 RepID=A0ABR3G8J9_9PEZI